MKFTKLDLLTMLIGLFLFASCKDSNTIGLDDADIAIKGSLMDSTTVTSQTLRDDVTSGVALTRHPLGFMTDPVFGLTEASLAMAVGVPSTTHKFGTNAVIDSAVLVLPYSTNFYGDTTSAVYTVNVNQLSNDISKENSYLINKDWPAQTTIQGTFSGKIKPNTKFKISTIVTGGPDTLKTVDAPQLRVKLNNSFIQNNIMNLDSVTLSDANNFYKSFKGFKITASATGSGGIMFFDFSGTNGKIEIYYKKQNATTSTARDTVTVNFPIGNTSGPVTASIKHDYTGTAIESQLGNPNPATPYAVTYLQALAGLRNKISFPHLKQFLTDLRAKPGNSSATKVIVNKAELVIDLSPGTDVIPFNAAQRLSLYRHDIAGQRKNVPDNDNSIQGSYLGDRRALGDPILFGGYFDSVRQRYLFTITSYVQDLLDGKTEDYGTYLAPSAVTEYNVSPSVTSAARSVISKWKKNPAAGDKLIKLNIYYTQIN